MVWKMLLRHICLMQTETISPITLPITPLLNHFWNKNYALESFLNPLLCPLCLQQMSSSMVIWQMFLSNDFFHVLPFSCKDHVTLVLCCAFYIETYTYVQWGHPMKHVSASSSFKGDKGLRTLHSWCRRHKEKSPWDKSLPQILASMC